jgi:site-specific recombinase XerC
LQDALKKNLIPFNPADRATLPAKQKFVGRAYTVEQANELLKIIGGEPIKPTVILGLFYGFRRSEIPGLRWGDINLDSRTICICNAAVKRKTTIEAEQTKSEASKR